MRLLHIDPFSGASGDMLLAALIDAGVDVQQLAHQLERLGVDGWTLNLDDVIKVATRAVRATVGEPVPAAATRRWADIRGLLESSGVDEAPRRRALAVFARLAAAEARVHGVAADDVVFHEIGGVDTIVDIVGVCAAVHLLGVERITCSTVPLGGGSVQTRHGELPVPAPAVLELLKGAPVSGTADPVELCTPTGAALLAELVDDWEAMPAMSVQAIGYGAGTRDLNRPNVLRVVVGEAGPAALPVEGADLGAEALVILEATVDDMTGEVAAVVLNALRAGGARDAWARQVLMKKGRPGLEIACLVEPDRLEAVRDELFRQSTTLGVRAYPVQRWTLARDSTTVQVAGYPVRVKVGRRDGKVVNAAPELDDCLRVAAATQLPVKQVIDRAQAAWLREQRA